MTITNAGKLAQRIQVLGRHRPPPGLAFGEPDDRVRRAIQYAAAPRSIMIVSGILDRPAEPGDDSGELLRRLCRDRQLCVAGVRELRTSALHQLPVVLLCRTCAALPCRANHPDALAHPASSKRGVARDRHDTRGGDAVDVVAPPDEWRRHGRSSRVVPAPRCWRQACRRSRAAQVMGARKPVPKEITKQP
jgi:hypothetical protein